MELQFLAVSAASRGATYLRLRVAEQGIELTRHEIDAELIRESAGRAEVLWEQEPGASGRSTHAVSQTTTASDHA